MMVYKEVPASSPLGEHLKSVRTIHGLSLRAVAQPAEISVAYLQKLEGGDVRQPSPNVLLRLGKVLNIPYDSLMAMAGYATTDPLGQDAVLGSRTGQESFASVIDSSDLTDDERRAVAAFIAHLRDQRPDAGKQRSARKSSTNRSR